MTERQSYQGQELSSQEERVEQAQRAMASFAESIQALAEANKSLLEDRNRLFGCGVQGSLTANGVFHVLECTASFFEGTTLHFRGYRFGSGSPLISEGRFQGVANFSVPPSELVGDGDSWMEFYVRMSQMSGVTPARMAIDWFAGHPPGYKLVGTYLGDGTPGSNPPLNGTGIWTDITDRS